MTFCYYKWKHFKKDQQHSKCWKFHWKDRRAEKCTNFLKSKSNFILKIKKKTLSERTLSAIKQFTTWLQMSPRCETRGWKKNLCLYWPMLWLVKCCFIRKSCDVCAISCDVYSKSCDLSQNLVILWCIFENLVMYIVYLVMHVQYLVMYIRKSCDVYSLSCDVYSKIAWCIFDNLVKKLPTSVSNLLRHLESGKEDPLDHRPLRHTH